MQNLLRLDYEKILLLSTTIFRGDYPRAPSLTSQFTLPAACPALPDSLRVSVSVGAQQLGLWPQTIFACFGLNPAMLSFAEGEYGVPTSCPRIKISIIYPHVSTFITSDTKQLCGSDFSLTCKAKALPTSPLDAGSSPA
jgi:hypothetical protein